MANDPQREYPNTYFVEDRSNQEELTRVQIQDQLLTRGMGGVLPEQADPTRFQHILDVGCGSGGWLIEIAKTYPDIPHLVGVDASKKMVDYARMQAEEQGVADRVKFRMMDALLILEFPEASFDLVNERFGVSYLRTWDWPKLLSEFRRVSRRGGVIRTTETEVIIQSPSVALTTLCEISQTALYQAGHLLSAETEGITGNLTSLMERAGIQNRQTQLHPILYRTGTPEGQHFYEDIKRYYRTVEPFFRKWTRVPDNYKELYEQALIDIQQPDFVATWRLLTVWGTNPRTNSSWH